jgi:cellulose synthase/poly-beta-1,6-N-acetylglucosamine synthase-like glycosyltransferase
MTLEITKIGKKAIYEPRAVSWTSTPKTFKALKGQRKRWYRGNLQAFRYYKDMFFNIKHGVLGFFWLPYLYFWGFGGAVFESLLIAASIPSLLYINSMYLTVISLCLYVLFELINVMIYILALILEKQASFRLIIATIIIKPYSIFMTFVRLLAIYYELRNKKTTWS